MSRNCNFNFIPGMNEYISKPVNPQEIIEKISTWFSPTNLPSVDKLGIPGIQEKNMDDNIIDSSVWDHQSALSRVLGKEAILDNLINLFLSDTPQNIEQLEQAIQQEDIDSVRLKSHTIKGVAGNIGGSKLHELAGQIEKDAKKQQTINLTYLGKLLRIEFEKLQTVLKKYKNERQKQQDTNDKGSDFKSSELLSELDLLRKQLVSGNFISDQQLKVLSPLMDSEIYCDDTRRLKELILQFDSENAVVVIDKLKKSIKAYS
ncbi:MAG: Hpt domain-containing protein [Kangiellaceae bacterium]|nr:Hpt domain-containing protein [Kangiellaceae bacterium]